jgi:hypothetical protein
LGEGQSNYKEQARGKAHMNITPVGVMVSKRPKEEFCAAT